MVTWFKEEGGASGGVYRFSEREVGSFKMVLGEVYDRHPKEMSEFVKRIRAGRQYILFDEFGIGSYG